ncbi:acyltransferase family protein [Planosporangium sp. 12N6]|uniref:acyltransferase family protein n=1 Tax=Planosporangium spinosum TaxID=3402278 RepID=UPI003CEC55D6
MSDLDCAPDRLGPSRRPRAVSPVPHPRQPATPGATPAGTTAVPSGSAMSGSDAGTTAAGTAEAGTGGAPGRPRSRYLDALRTAAIVRVYLHHALWVGWLTLLFPSLSVMFALAGCLTASSLDRRGSVGTVSSRMRRLLPPLWVLAMVATPVMFAHGWLTDADNPLHWPDLAWWILPLANPPASAWGLPFALALWYLRAYLWLVLLSPALWWAFRRWPLATLVVPLTAAALFHSPLVNLPADKVTDVVLSTATYGTCWLIGFARYTRQLDRIPGWVCGLVAAALAGSGLAWAGLHRGVTALSEDPLADLLWGTGFALALMRLRPTMAWLGRAPRLNRLVSAINARAVTIYVWHLPALFATGALLRLTGFESDGYAGAVATLTVGSALTAVAVLATGWVEDLAAARRPSVIPTAGRRPRADSRATGTAAAATAA